MAELRQLKLRRTNIKGQMTRMNNSLDGEIAASEAQIRAHRIEELFNSFNEIQTQIDNIRLAAVPAGAGEEALITEIQRDSDAERTVFEGSYYAAAVKANRKINAEAQQQIQAQPQNANNRVSNDRSLEIKLPVLKLPEFEGEYEEWLLFKDAFTTMIHQREGLTPIQKFQYLRSALRGEALLVIGGLETSAENYENAWELLTNAYENTKLLINTHLNHLLDFPIITKDKPASLKQLVVHIRTHLKALKTLKLPVDKWDELLIHLVKNKMDYNTKKDWEEETNRDKARRKTLEEFLTFLSERCRTFEMIDKGKNRQDISKPPVVKKQERRVVAVASASARECISCSEGHGVYQCPKFLKLPISERINEIKSKKLCLNCFGKGHYATACRSSACKRCQKKHNTLLHLEQENADRKTNEDSSKKSVVTHCAKEEESSSSENTCLNINFVRKPTTRVILSTARVNVEDASGNQQSCRVLLDNGSQLNLVSEELVRRLKLKCNKQDELIGGVNSSKITSAKTAQIKIRSRHAAYEAIIECLVLPTVTEKLPQVKINTKLICVPDGLELADPNFHEPGPVDVLLGAGLFWQLMCADSIIQQKGLPTLKNTLLGWIVGGELIDAKPKSPKLCGLITNSALQKQLERFWNQEETNETRLLTEDEADCERQFEESLKRDETGRFIVALPKKENVVLGESENQAIRRLYAIERRFKANPAIKSDYIKFMKDYEDQGHMSTIVDESARSKDIYILPHQPVIRPDSMTTKLRVVFDASAKTSNGMALNDKLMVGPNLQRDLFDIILRFRAHEFVITADITAMFRQIMIREEDRDLQRILWRSDQTKPIKSYRLNTVTYGTAPAPYLAIRCLRQLAKENMDFPEASRVLREDFYMDDVLTGARTVEAAMALQQQLSELLQRGQFQLRKWRSNEPRVLENLSNETEVDSLMKIDKDGALKTLGLLWNAKSDTMQYRVEIEEKEAKITKRLVLSKISQVFDPLGLLGPVIINGKWIMQQMWQLNTGWDEPLSQGLRETWNQYYSDLPRINQVQISRNINGENVEETFDLVGFGDASEKAYGACLYAISRNKEGQLQSHLICSKSRVAPLKTISLPRLELNAALLLSKLSDAARKAYGDKIKGLYLWSDSTIVLSWIATAPNILKTYVANRVSKIQDLTKNVNWMHVPSKENPADLISRGMTVDNWKNNELWWHGPSWLVKGEWPQRKEIEIGTSEMKSAVVLLITTTYDVLRRFSSLEKLQRIIAYWLRFKTNALGGKKNGTLSVEELAVAERSIIKMTQRESFSMELQALEHDESVPKNSKLAAFCPFLDENGLIRVGGRLMRADIPEEAKHPVIIPSKHHITKIIMKKEHLRLHHCGPEQLLYSLRQKYWPLSGRREAQKVTRSCLECFRRKPKFPEIIMGDLPSGRISGSLRPFTNAGVDYAGPLQVRESRRRGRIHVSKAWIAVFVCFATKAVHLELVTELTTESFLAALRRFVGRRGVCSQISSDNGTNFVGAAKDLKEVYEFLKTEHDAIADNLARQRIEWKFIPPRAPHFGGLWEAAVKATKKHLNLVTKGLVFTFEEYYTLLVEIESILNSRPLTPMSSDPNDLSALTPAHFLVGDTLLLPAEQNYAESKDNTLSRWQHLQKVRQHFWKRWHQEYLQELQKRQKWRTEGENLRIGTLVLLKEDNVSPLHWIIGRVVQVHPGADNVVRVATVRTSRGLFKRAVKNLSPLPTEEENI